MAAMAYMRDLLPVFSAPRGDLAFIVPGGHGGAPPRPKPVQLCEWEELSYDVDREAEPCTVPSAHIVFATDNGDYYAAVRGFNLCIAHARTMARRRLEGAHDLARRVGLPVRDISRAALDRRDMCTPCQEDRDHDACAGVAGLMFRIPIGNGTFTCTCHGAGHPTETD